MWLRKGSYVTSDNEVQYPYPPWRQVQGGVHPPDTGSGGWGSDGAHSSVEGLRIPEDREPEARETEAREPEVGETEDIETEARDPGIQPEARTMGNNGGRRQVG